MKTDSIRWQKNFSPMPLKQNKEAKESLSRTEMIITKMSDGEKDDS